MKVKWGLERCKSARQPLSSAELWRRWHACLWAPKLGQPAPFGNWQWIASGSSH